MKSGNCYSIIITAQSKRKNKKEAQNMKKAKTYAGVGRATTLTNNNQAKQLALLSILKTGYKYENT